MAAGDFRHHGVPASFVGGIMKDKGGVGLLFEMARRVGVSPREDDRRPLGGEPPDDGRADPGRPARNQRHLSRQSIRHPAILPLLGVEVDIKSRLPVNSQDQGVSMTWHDVAARDEISDGRILRVIVGDHAILLVGHEGAVHAIGSKCTHAGADLSAGRLRGEQILCPRHGMRFSVTDGAPTGPLSREPLPVWLTRTVKGRVQVLLRSD